MVEKYGYKYRMCQENKKIPIQSSNGMRNFEKFPFQIFFHLPIALYFDSRKIPFPLCPPNKKPDFKYSGLRWQERDALFCCFLTIKLLLIKLVSIEDLNKKKHGDTKYCNVLYVRTWKRNIMFETVPKDRRSTDDGSNQKIFNKKTIVLRWQYCQVL